MQVLLAWGMAAILFELLLGVLVGKALARAPARDCREASPQAPASAAGLVAHAATTAG